MAYLWSPRHHRRNDVPATTASARRRRGGRTVAVPLEAAPLRCTPQKKKTYFDRPLSEEYTRKTDGRRRPMPQQIWKGPEIKIHDAWETARPFYATTNLLAASLVYARMPWHASIYNVSYQRSGRGGRLTTAAQPSATAGRSPGATCGTASAGPGRSPRSTRSLRAAL